MRVVNLGCGSNKSPGAVGVDHDPTVHPDVIHDLDCYPYPFEDETFDEVIASHVIEHLAEPWRFMREIHRIAKPNAHVYLVTPHYTGHLSYADLGHKHHLGYTSFTWVCDSGLFVLDRVRVEFSDFYRVIGVSVLANWFPHRWEKYLGWILPALYVRVWLRALKPPREAARRARVT